MELILKNVQKKHLALIAELAKTLKIDIEEAKADEQGEYDPEFVKKIQKGDDDLKQGKGVKMNVNELWK
jgi:hypothetical protein